MNISRRFLPKALLVGLLLSVAIFPLVEQDAGAAADPLTPGERAFVAAHGPIRYAPDPLFPPFEFLDPSGVARGITPDLLTVMGKKLGVEFRTVAYPTWSDVLEAVKRGKVDLLGTLTRTPEREGFLLFSRPYLSVPYVLFVRRDGGDPETIDGMVSRRLGVVRNYGINAWLSAEHPNIRPVAVEDTATGLTMVAMEQLDALLETLPVGAHIVRDKSLTNIRIVPHHIYTLPQHFGVRKGEPLLLSIVQKGLDSLTETERSEAFVRWTGQDFSRPPPAISPLLRNALLVLVAVAVLSVAWIAVLRRNVRRATQSLRESEEKFRTVADYAYDWESWMAPDRSMRYVSPSCERITGYPAEAFAGDPGLLRRIVHPEDRPWFDEHICDYLEGAKRGDADEESEFRIVRSDGEVRWIGHVCKPVFGADGIFQGRRGSNRDITERKRAEEALRESASFIRTVMDNLPVGIAVNSVGPSVDFEYMNDNFPRFYRTTREALGEPNAFWDAVYVDPEFREEIRKRVLEDCASGDPERMYWVDVPIARKGEGTTFISARNTRILDKQLMISTVWDVTDRKRAEEEKRNLQEQLQTEGSKAFLEMESIMAVIPDIFFKIDLDANLVKWNKIVEVATGLAPEMLIKRPVLELIVEEDRPSLIASIRKCLEEGEAKAEARVLNAHGGSTLYQFLGVTLKDEGGNIVGITGTGRDITESKRAEEEKEKLREQLQQAMKMEAVGQLAGGVAHDFNNLLTVIIGNVSLALGKVPPSEPVAGMLSEVNKAAERAARLTQQLLAFSRKQIIEPKVLDLNEMITGMHTMLVRLIGENIELKTVPGEDLGRVKVDTGQFEQILVNLAVNARDAMPDGGKLLIETANVDLDDAYCALHPYVRPGRFVMLAVSDTGQGMTGEIRKQIFEPFFTTKPKGSGTGLGLATIYGAVKQSDGSIEVYSEVGKGTAFKIYLPRVEGEVARPVKSAPSQELPGGTETVLFVEDEEVLRKLCVRILEHLGYRVMQAGNGDEAIALATGYGERIDLLMTDVVMPGMHGRELANRLTGIHPETRALFTSGYTDNAIVQHGVLDEGVSFIGKPYTPSALARKVREVLDRVG